MKLAPHKRKTANDRRNEALARIKAFREEYEKMPPAQQKAVQVIANRIQGYSLYNRILIIMQASLYGFEPSAVATFKAWLSAGRCVRKGEHAMFIYAPCTRKGKGQRTEEPLQVTAEQLETLGDKVQYYFRLVPVFDLSQTDVLPEALPQPQEGGAA